MRYTDKFNKIKTFVKLNIPHNKINFTKSEKSQITRYYNNLYSMGYFNREQEGFVEYKLKNKEKIHNLPKLKIIKANVGTSNINGKIITDNDHNIKIENGIIKVKRGKAPYYYEFYYNIKKDWNVDNLAKHLKNRMKPNKPKKGNIFRIGAGIYEMRGIAETDFKQLANIILKISGKYYNDIEMGERNKTQSPEFFMKTIRVYESFEAFKLRGKNQKKRKKKVKHNGRN